MVPTGAVQRLDLFEVLDRLRRLDVAFARDVEPDQGNRLAREFLRVDVSAE